MRSISVGVEMIHSRFRTCLLQSGEDEERAAGGTFHDAGDEEIIFRRIRIGKSWWHGPQLQFVREPFSVFAQGQ